MYGIYAQRSAFGHARKGCQGADLCNQLATGQNKDRIVFKKQLTANCGQNVQNIQPSYIASWLEMVIVLCKKSLLFHEGKGSVMQMETLEVDHCSLWLAAAGESLLAWFPLKTNLSNFNQSSPPPLKMPAPPWRKKKTCITSAVIRLGNGESLFQPGARRWAISEAVLIAFEYHMKSIDTRRVSYDKSLKQMDDSVCVCTIGCC